MKVYIPVCEYRIDYQTAESRPVTELELLVLRAIDEEADTAGAVIPANAGIQEASAGKLPPVKPKADEKKVSTIEKLSNIFKLPERILVESVVTLIRESWVALHPHDKGFMITLLGKNLIEKGELPQTEVKNRYTTIYQELLTGLLAQKIRYDKLSWKKQEEETCLKADMLPGYVGQFEHLLYKKRSAWLREVSVPILTKNGIWLKVQVDLKKNNVAGLPDLWQDPRLQEKILEKTCQKLNRPRSASPSSEKTVNASAPPSYNFSIDPEELQVTAEQHVKRLKQALQEARTHLLIVSAHIDEDSLNELKSSFVEALQRGIYIDIVWGLSGKECLEKWVKNIREGIDDKYREHMAFNSNCLNCDAKLLIYDTETERENVYTAIIGSFNWLKFQTNSRNLPGNDVSVCVSDSVFAAKLCRTVSGWLMEELSGIANRWSNIAAELERKAAREKVYPASEEEDDEEAAEKVQEGGGTSCKASLVLNEPEHIGILSHKLQKVAKRCLIVSHNVDFHKIYDDKRLAWPFEKRASSGNLTDDFSPIIQCGRQIGEEEKHNALASINGRLICWPGLHARLLVADSDALITSCNLLSASKRMKQLGILIEQNRGIANRLWETFMPDNKLKHLRVSNFRSLKDINIETGELTVLFGPNGAGKSAFLDTLCFVQECAARGVDAASSIRNHGIGMLWDKGPGDASIKIEIETGSVTYEVSFGFSSGRIEPFIGERLYSKRRGEELFDRKIGSDKVVFKGLKQEPYGVLLKEPEKPALSRYIELLNDSEAHEAHGLYELLQNVRFHHSRSARFHHLRRLGSENRRETRLSADCDNLWSVLRNLRDKSNADERYNTIIKFMKESFPDFKELSFELTGPGSLYAEFMEENRRKPVPASSVSDGYLQMLANLTALFSAMPKDNILVFLDEPDLSLHPWALSKLAEAVTLATQDWNRQVFIATHSPVLMSQFEPESVLVTEMGQHGQTVLTRTVNIAEIQDLLEEYAIGSLYMAEEIAPQSKKYKRA